MLNTSHNKRLKTALKTKPKTLKRLFYILLALTLTYAFNLQVKAASGPTFKWNPQVAFKLPATNTIVKFADWAYFSSFEWDKWQPSKITFNNLLVGSGSALSSLCLSSPDTDITILSANSESVKLNLADTNKILEIWNLDVKTVNIGGNYFTKNDFFVSYSEWQACNQDSIFQNETLTAIKAVSSTTVTLGLTNPTPIWQIQGEGKNATWYFRADTHTINGISGFRLNEAPSTTSISDSVTTEGSYVIYYGVRVWIVHSNGALDELTDGEPVAIVSRNEVGAGLQSATWDCPGYNNVIDAIMIKVYLRFGIDGEWNLRATFITENETLIKLPEATWTFQYYTVRDNWYESYKWWTKAQLYWGENYETKVEIQYVEPEVYEVMIWKLWNLDILGFLMIPYTWFLGFTAYALVFLLPFGIVLYNRLEDAVATLIALLLIGGFTGGLIGVFVPASGLMLCWVLFVLGIAALLYRLIKG